MAQLVDDLLDELVAEVHAGEARLTRGDRVEDRGVGAVDRIFAVEQLGQVVGESVGQRDLDEDDRLVHQRGVEEAVAPLVTVEPVPQVVPAGDGVHRFGRHQPVEHRRGRVPRDLAELEQAHVEQGRQVTGELVVQQPQRGIVAADGTDVGAQLDQETDTVWQPRDHVQPCRVPGDDRAPELALRGDAVGPRARHAEAVDGTVDDERVGTELGDDGAEEPTPAVEVEPRVGGDQSFGRRPLCGRLALGQRLVDRLHHPGDVTGGQVGSDHQTARTTKAAQETEERSAAGRFGHGSSTPHRRVAPPLRRRYASPRGGRCAAVRAPAPRRRRQPEPVRSGRRPEAWRGSARRA